MQALLTKLCGFVMLGARGELGVVDEAGKFILDGAFTRAFAAHNVRFIRTYQDGLNDHRFCIALVYQSTVKHPWGTNTLTISDSLVRSMYSVSGANNTELTSFQKKNRHQSVFRGMELLLEYANKDAPDHPVFCPVLFDRGTTLADYDRLFQGAFGGEDRSLRVLEVLNLLGPVAGTHQAVEEFQALKQAIHQNLIHKENRKTAEFTFVQDVQAREATAALPDATDQIAAPRASTPRFDQRVQINPSAAAPSRGHPPPSLNSTLWFDPRWNNATCMRLARWLINPRQFVNVSALERFPRFRDFTAQQRNRLAAACPVYRAPANTPLLDIGTGDPWNLYLLRGDVELTGRDGLKRLLSANADDARTPVCFTKPRAYGVTTVTDTHFLWIHEEHLAQLQRDVTAEKLDLV